VDITPTLKARLMPHRKFTGPIFPTGRPEGVGGPSGQVCRNDFDEAREKAGTAEWDENTLRHHFSSYHLTDPNDLKKTSVEMGHATGQTTQQHYLNADPAAESAKFWKLTTGTDEGKMIRTAGEARHKRRA
jgi:integrase